MGNDVSSERIREAFGAEESISLAKAESALRKLARKTKVRTADSEARIHDELRCLKSDTISFDQFEALFVRLHREQLAQKDEEDLTASVASLVADPSQQCAVLEPNEEPCKGLCCTELRENYSDYEGNLPCVPIDLAKAQDHSAGKHGLTLYVVFGQRQSDWLRFQGKYGNHNHRFEPENAPVEKYVVSPGMSHSEFRNMLENKHNKSIYFHRWDYGKNMVFVLFVKKKVVV
jgi:hypothetical protein